MRQFLSSNLKWLLPAGAVAVVVVAYLAFSVFAVHTFFIDKEVAEAMPVFASGASETDVEAEAMSEVEVMSEVDETEEASADEASADEASADEASAEEASGIGTVPEEPVADNAPAEATTVTVEYAGDFVDRSHPSAGVASVLGDGSGQRFVRFENFETDNGPDLNVYLSTAPPDAPAGDFDDDFIDLGDLKGNVGPQNYEIPEGTDLERYSTVVIWCVRFGVAFGTAGLVAS